jgi:hypothetical protein
LLQNQSVHFMVVLFVGLLARVNEVNLGIRFMGQVAPIFARASMKRVLFTLLRTYGCDAVRKESLSMVNVLARGLSCVFASGKSQVRQAVHGRATMVRYPPRISKLGSYPNDFRLCGSNGTKTATSETVFLLNYQEMKAYCG